MSISCSALHGWLLWPCSSLSGLQVRGIVADIKTTPHIDLFLNSVERDEYIQEFRLHLLNVFVRMKWFVLSASKMRTKNEKICKCLHIYQWIQTYFFYVLSRLSAPSGNTSVGSLRFLSQGGTQHMCERYPPSVAHAEFLQKEGHFFPLKQGRGACCSLLRAASDTGGQLLMSWQERDTTAELSSFWHWSSLNYFLANEKLLWLP